MKRIKLSIVLWIFGFAVCFAAPRALAIDSLMRVLEDVLDHRGDYVEKRTKEISKLKGELRSADDPVQRYELIGHLFDAYKPFNTDSAYFYSLQREMVARELGDPDRILTAKFNRASALQAVGMYKEVSDLLQDVNPAHVPDYLKGYYYHILRTLQGNMADFSAFPPLRAQYNALTRLYRDSIIKANPEGSLARMVSLADQYNAYGQFEKGRDVMLDFISKNNLSDHDRAICAWTLAESYRQLGCVLEQKEQLLISSIGDMRAAVREYVSLRQLALLLYQEGDLERAYRFMNIAFEDANKSNARQRLVELSAYYPEITGIYVDKVKSQRRNLQLTLWVIIMLAVALVGVLLFVWKQMKIISRSRKELQTANDSLNSLNGRLQTTNIALNNANTRLSEANGQLEATNRELRDANRKLAEINHALKEASHLKETYIGKYMDQCVAQIGMLDTYRKSLLKMATANKWDELRSRLKSTELLDERRKEFYDSFDETFLSLFPNFIEDFNALLAPGEEIRPRSKGRLNTELRIFALIRLGISDSDSIASFLRYSVTTVYNYRTKIRNKARGERSELENLVRTISGGV